MKHILVHMGSRDHYQVANSLKEYHKLKYLITDFAFANDVKRFRFLSNISIKIKYQLTKRKIDFINDRELVTLNLVSLIILLLKKIIPYYKVLFNIENKILQNKSIKIINKSDSNIIIAYNYNANVLFGAKLKKCKKVLFMCHPHPITCRTYLQEEILLAPEFVKSIQWEREIGWGNKYYKKLKSDSKYNYSG